MGFSRLIVVQEWIGHRPKRDWGTRIEDLMSLVAIFNLVLISRQSLLLLIAAIARHPNTFLALGELDQAIGGKKRERQVDFN